MNVICTKDSKTMQTTMIFDCQSVVVGPMPEEIRLNQNSRRTLLNGHITHVDGDGVHISVVEVREHAPAGPVVNDKGVGPDYL